MTRKTAPAVDTEFFELGRMNASSGIRRGTIHSHRVQDALQGLPVGSERGRQVMESYSAGWDKGHAEFMAEFGPKV
jgi:hypothetical protein